MIARHFLFLSFNSIPPFHPHYPWTHPSPHYYLPPTISLHPFSHFFQSNQIPSFHNSQSRIPHHPFPPLHPFHHHHHHHERLRTPPSSNHRLQSSSPRISWSRSLHPNSFQNQSHTFQIQQRGAEKKLTGKDQREVGER